MKDGTTDPLHHRFDARSIPPDWLRSAERRGSQASRPSRTHPHRPAPARRWLTTLPHPLLGVRDATLEALAQMQAQLAYLYHADDKIVVRAVRGEHQIRIELTPMEPAGTRIVVAATLGAEVDRSLSAQVVERVERQLTQAAARV
jgi:hypothetical protein